LCVIVTDPVVTDGTDYIEKTALVKVEHIGGVGSGDRKVLEIPTGMCIR